MDAPAVAPRPHTSVLKIVGHIVLAVVLVGAAIVLYRFISTSFIAPAELSSSTRVFFAGHDPYEPYIVGKNLVRKESIPTDKTVVLETAESPSLPKVALARVPGKEGVVFGTIGEDGTFTAVVDDGTEKGGIAIRPDGYAVYAALPAGIKKVDMELRTPGSASPDTSTEEPFTIEIASSTQEATSEVVLGWHLFAVQVQGTTHTPVDLGAGRAPRLSSDGVIIALTEKGIGIADPVIKKINVLFPFPGASGFGSALSPDGTRAALVRTNGPTDFFAIAGANQGPAGVTYLGILAEADTGEIAFLTSDRVIVKGKNNPGVTQVFEVPTQETKAATLRASVPIVTQ